MGASIPRPSTPTDRERIKIEKPQSHHGGFVNLDDELTKALVAKGERMEPGLDEIDWAAEARAVFGPENFRIVGCIANG